MLVCGADHQYDSNLPAPVGSHQILTTAVGSVKRIGRDKAEKPATHRLRACPKPPGLPQLIARQPLQPQKALPQRESTLRYTPARVTASGDKHRYEKRKPPL